MRDGHEKHAAGLTRRRVMRDALVLAAAGLVVPYAGPVAAAPKLPDNPFKLGVASGDPLPDGIVLWTRLALRLEDGVRWGLTDAAYQIGWEVWEADAPGKPVVRRGTAIAAQRNAYAVHVEVNGLRPGRLYGYRFTLGEYADEGITRTAPAAGEMVEKLRFAFCSCAEYENGFHYAYEYMARENPQFIVHLGDYIYEQVYDQYYRYDPIVSSKGDVPPRTDCPVVTSPPRKRVLRYDRVDKLRTLSQYRRRYAEYKLDPHLQFAHRQCPFVVTWDDHEVDNDYAGSRSATREEDDFPRRQVNAYRAYFENLPIRLSALPVRNERRRLYRHFDFGGLMRLYMLDERQYRSPQPCARNEMDGKGRIVVPEGACGREIASAIDTRGQRREMLGREQEQWLAGRLSDSKAHWNVLAQGVMMANLDARADCHFNPISDKRQVWTDNWGGYLAARQRVVDLMDAHRAKNPVVIGGDVHCHFANRIVKDPADQQSKLVAPEFVCTAISSWTRHMGAVMGEGRGNENITVGVHGDYNGYVVCDVTKDEFVASMVSIDARADKIGDTPVAVHKYSVRAGHGEPEKA